MLPQGAMAAKTEELFSPCSTKKIEEKCQLTIGISLVEIFFITRRAYSDSPSSATTAFIELYFDSRLVPPFLFCVETQGERKGHTVASRAAGGDARGFLRLLLSSVGAQRPRFVGIRRRERGVRRGRERRERVGCALSLDSRDKTIWKREGRKKS